MNLQNIPRSDKRIKQLVIPKLDLFLMFDYSNIELRILAYYLSTIGDHTLAQEFYRGEDMHANSAAGIFGIPVSEVTDEQRQIGKGYNFSVVYGGGVDTIIAQGLAKDEDEARAMLDAYHGARPGIRILVANLRGTMRDRRRTGDGFVRTVWGRKLHPQADHKILNSLCQGCAADLMKDAIRNCHRWVNEEGLKSHVVLSIHDELVWDVRDDELEEVIDNVPHLMTTYSENQQRIDNVVPIEVEAQISRSSWAAKEPLVTY